VKKKQPSNCDEAPFPQRLDPPISVWLMLLVYAAAGFVFAPSSTVI